jgi:hypothetical protein
MNGLASSPRCPPNASPATPVSASPTRAGSHSFQTARPSTPKYSGHRDLHAGHALTVPQVGQRDVGEPQVLELDDRFLGEEVIDAQDLALAQQSVQPGRERLLRNPRIGDTTVSARWKAEFRKAGVISRRGRGRCARGQVRAAVNWGSSN